MQDINGLAVEANRFVAGVLEERVHQSKTAEQFQNQMTLLQLAGTRLLAVLIFNSAKNTGKTTGDLLTTMNQMLEHQLNDILEAAKGQKLETIDLNFGEAKADV